MAIGPATASDLKVQIVEGADAEKVKYALKELLDYLAESNCEVYSIQYQVDNGKYSFALIYGFVK